MKFWDSSAVLPHCLHEPQTPNLKKLCMRDGAIVAWWGTAVECYSALARLRREQALSTADETQVRAVVHALMATWTEIEPSRAVREQAGRVLLLHPLRAADAFQLAAAIIWANGQASGHEFVCLDHRLREAAQREGFTVLPNQL
jgi:predicted nucleic acid-binding protein